MAALTQRMRIHLIQQLNVILDAVRQPINLIHCRLQPAHTAGSAQCVSMVRKLCVATHQRVQDTYRQCACMPSSKDGCCVATAGIASSMMACWPASTAALCMKGAVSVRWMSKGTERAQLECERSTAMRTQARESSKDTCCADPNLLN